MNRLILPLIFVLGSFAAKGELLPPQPTIRAVADPSMVVVDRGAKLEVFPTKRAVPQEAATGRVVAHHVITARAADPIGSLRLGVVFNHAMQQQGYISGEIAFKVKNGHAFSGNPALYPGLKEITKPAVYVVNARTPIEFIKVLKRLQARSDLEWVEPTVTYGASDVDRSSTK